MTIWQRLLLGALLMAASTGEAHSQTPPAGLTAPQLEQAASDVLKEVHNRGADLYNRGDPAAAYRMYEGALSVVRPFVAHRPAILKAIEDGLNETAKTDGAKIQAFRLHEVIEQVRADLKAEIARAAEAKPAQAPKTTPLPLPKPVETPKPVEKASPMIAGRLLVKGKPLEASDVTLVSLDQKLPRVFTATSNERGEFQFADAIPLGQYAAMVTGKGVSARYTTVSTSPLRIEVGASATPLNFELE